MQNDKYDLDCGAGNLASQDWLPHEHSIEASMFRTQTTRLVAGRPALHMKTRAGVRGVVIRNALEYGRGPINLVGVWIRLASRVKHGTYIEPGTNCWSFVHYDDLADIYCRALLNSGSEKIFHAASETISMKAIAGAIHRGFGFLGQPSDLSLDEVSRLTPGAEALTRNMAISGDLVMRTLAWRPVHSVLRPVESQAVASAEWRRAK